MAIKNLFSTLVKISCIFLLLACSHVRRADRSTEPKPEAVSTDKPSEQKPIALILGPGGLKSFAHIGVIKNLQKENILVSRIIGLEWGAVIAATFARKAKIHDLEWQMTKLKSEHLPYSGFFKNKKDLENPLRLNLFFERVFPSYDLAKSEIPFSCPTKNINIDAPSWLQSGPAAKELKKCVAYPPLFYPYNTWHADALAVNEAIKKIRSEGDFHIILVNVIDKDNFKSSAKVIDQESEKILWQELRKSLQVASREVDTYIAIDTSKFSVLDLGARSDLIQVGQEKSAAAILNLKR